MESRLTNREARERKVVALTKRALERRMRNGGCPRKEAERIVARMSHSERLKRLPLMDIVRIAFARVT